MTHPSRLRHQREWDADLCGADLHGDPGDDWTAVALAVLASQVGRLIYQGVPTGVAIVPALHHGGPYRPAVRPGETSVGTDAIYRFLLPLAFQDFPRGLPDALCERV